jgi:hypothetical protein
MDVPEAQEEEEGGRKRDEKKRRREEETEKTDGEDETGKMERTNGGIKSPIQLIKKANLVRPTPG